MTTGIRRFAEHFQRTSHTRADTFLEEFLKSLNYVVGLDQLLDNICAKLLEILHAKTLFIVLFEPITSRYIGTKARGANTEQLSLLSFSGSDLLVRWLNVNRSPLEIVGHPEVVKYLSAGEREVLRRTNSVLVVPMIVLNRLIGAYFVAERTDGRPYTKQQIERLVSLSAQSALAIENAMMYRLQEERLQKLFHADKLASVGELAAGAAHEIRNPLTAIRSTIQYLSKELPAEKMPLVDGLIDEVDRIDQIIAGLLSFSRTSELVMAQVNLPDLIEQTLALLEPELRKHGVALEKRYVAADPCIAGDAPQLKQVFLNILLNSIQALPDGGTVGIAVEEPSNQGELVRVTIHDDGHGILEKDLPKVFDPFYTTKSGGTGLGLSITYGIVSKHSGKIQITGSAEGPTRGTTVRIDLPRRPGGRGLDEP